MIKLIIIMIVETMESIIPTWYHWTWWIKCRSYRRDENGGTTCIQNWKYRSSTFRKLNFKCSFFDFNKFSKIKINYCHCFNIKIVLCKIYKFAHHTWTHTSNRQNKITIRHYSNGNIQTTINANDNANVWHPKWYPLLELNFDSTDYVCKFWIDEMCQIHLNFLLPLRLAKIILLWNIELNRVKLQTSICKNVFSILNLHRSWC